MLWTIHQTLINHRIPRPWQTIYISPLNIESTTLLDHTALIPDSLSLQEQTEPKEMAPEGMARKDELHMFFWSCFSLFFSVFSFFLHSGTLCFLALGLVDIGFGLAQLKDVAKREMTRARASRSFICALSSKVYHHHLPTFLSTASNQSIEQIYFGILHTVYSSGLALESFTVHFVSSLCWIDGTCSSMHFRFNGVSSNLQSYLYPQHLRYAPQVLCLYVHFHRVFSRFVQGFFRVSLYRCFFSF